MPGLGFLEQALEALSDAGLRRQLRQVVGQPGRVVDLDGRRVVNFSSNNYLGLAGHPELVAAARGAADDWGTGGTASRLIVGNLELHERLEASVAEFSRRESARLFNSGYQANIGTIPALVERGDVVFSDALNHASLIDGCRLSRARVAVYPHRNCGRLAQLLGEHASARRKLIVTDSVFSMDGDRAPLPELMCLAEEHDAALMVDEAHAFGALGSRGRGAAAEAGVVPDVLMGTFGKALGSFGAFVGGEASLVEYLLNRARSFVFTTSLPPAVVAASLAALELARGPAGDARRAALAENVRRFRNGLAEAGLLADGAGTTPVFPVVVGDEARAMVCTRRLLRAGVFAQGIRPPTVPPGTARLRFAVMATHTSSDLDFALSELHQLRDRGLLPPAPDRLAV